MKIMLVTLSIAAMACTAIATLAMLVLHVAGAANAGDQQIRSMKFSAGSLTVFAVACVAAGIYLMRVNQTGWAAGISFAPTVIMGLILAIALLK
jgi:hypothetical protein